MLFGLPVIYWQPFYGQESKLNDLKMEVGRMYLAADASVVKIENKAIGFFDFPFKGSNGHYYSEKGICSNPYVNKNLMVMEHEPIVRPAEKKNDPVNHPKHYTSHPSGVECIDITRHMSFNLGNAVKYLWRNGLKDGAPSIQDLEKAVWYINDEINKLKGTKK